jgi:hypothetical protein
MKQITFLLIVSCFLLFACQKELSFKKEPVNIATLSSFTETNRNAGQGFTINSSVVQSITTEKGSKVEFKENSFVTQGGNPVTGSVDVFVKEVATPGEMILCDLPTMANGRLLESGGEYNITASQNGNQLKLAPGKYVKIEIPHRGNNMSGMQVFNGAADATGKVNWSVNTNPGNIVVGDSSLFSKSNLFCDSINWINCDKFINDPTVEFTVFPGNAPSSDSTNVFVHLTGRNTVAKMNWTQGLSYFKSNMLLAVPSTLVGISMKNGQLYASVISVNIQNGQSTTLNFTTYTEEQLKTRLALLR